MEEQQAAAIRHKEQLASVDTKLEQVVSAVLHPKLQESSVVTLHVSYFFLLLI